MLAGDMSALDSRYAIPVCARLQDKIKIQAEHKSIPSGSRTVKYPPIMPKMELETLTSTFANGMGLLTIIRKNRQKEKEMRILFL
jgi:hypothetical protein